ncbi:MAG: HEAT repeat domain-containing protein [Methanobacterium sp.]
MKCEDCGKTLPAFDFYKTKSASRGYTKKCKQCLKERTAKNALVNMKPYIRLNFPFYKKDLKNKMKKPISTLDNYIWALQELEFIEYIEDSNKYVIKSTENKRRFCNKNEIQFSYTINNEQYKTSKDVNPLDKEIKDLNDKSWFIRRRATKRIGDIGNQRAVEPLINALKDKNVFVKISAAESLGEIGDERAIQPLLNVNTRGNLKFDEIISTSIKNIKSRVENNIKKPECRTCTDCGKELPISDFYKSSNGPEGLMSYCKTCLKKRNAANALIEIKKYLSLNTSFSKERLKKLSNKSNATLGTYLHDLKELNLLEYNEHTGNYFLRPNNRLKEFCKDYNVPLFDKLPNDKNLKMCEGCGKNLPFDEFYKYHASPDGLTKKCINCIKKDNAANGIKEIIKLIGLDIPFSKERLSQKSAKLQDTINQYLRDLTLLDLIVYDESKDIYNLVLNNKIQAFSVEYGIDLKNKRKESKLDTNYLKNQMIQISTETTNSFILEFNEVAKRSDIIFILEDVKKKIFDLHLLELSVFPDGTGNISNQNYKIHIKIEVPSEKLQETLENLKARVTSKNQIELFGLMKVSL